MKLPTWVWGVLFGVFLNAPRLGGIVLVLLVIFFFLDHFVRWLNRDKTRPPGPGPYWID